ncbi:glycoside hydrolase superfamily [Coniella lustricola]|uniref:beta-glucosidase n=1 Tax=Coniella lustricola TaxID=2025994 RepID=A0A2T3ACR5_9PEZI|nr:glycoside hydrolase superfamily [Coniella lustricola]
MEYRPVEAKGGVSAASADKTSTSRNPDRFSWFRTKKGITITVVAVLIVIGGGLAGLAALRNRGGTGHGGSSSSGEDGNGTSGLITNDTVFYGLSPPVYPSPNISGTGSWALSLSRAQAMVANMTLDEKISLTAGSSSNTGCVGYLNPVERINFPGMCFQDAGNGVRAADFVSAWPAGIHVGASWNRNLSYQRALGMGGEFRTKGVNVLLGPVVSPVGRTVTSGRNWEGVSPDPYLSGALVFETVTGSQSAGVITSTKHFIGYEQETHRMPNGTAQSVSSNIDDQTMHELYLWPFQDAVYAGTANIMCSYQRVNNSYGCANSATLNGLLKTELGFQGFVVSDWGAQYTGLATALAGLDVTMPSAESYWGPQLSLAISNGSLAESRIDDMVTRLLAAWYQLGQDDGFPSPGVGLPQSLTTPHTIVDARNATFKQTLLDGAIEGHVLAKNTKSTLPLSKPKMLSIFGYSAAQPGQYNAEPSGGHVWTYGAEATDPMTVIEGFSGNLTYSYPQIATNGTLFCAGGSGANSAALGNSPMEALVQQAYNDDTALFWDFKSATPYVDGASNACLVFGNAWASEGSDRSGVRDDYTDSLIKHVASQCNNTIVVLHNAGVRLVDQFVDNENVTALIFAHLPGQESGRALISLLYGLSNNWGKLPYTVARNESDYGDLLDPERGTGEFELFPQANFTEGVFIDYRRFDAGNITPRYEFGYGLSYTAFGYSNLAVTQNTTANTSQYPSGEILQGGQVDLWDVLVSVTADIQNTGTMNGTEIAQLYVETPSYNSSNNTAGRPRVLRGFEKPLLAAGDKTTVTFALTRRDLSEWDTGAQKWLLVPGLYTIFVGASSRDLRLNGTFTV